MDIALGPVGMLSFHSLRSAGRSGPRSASDVAPHVQTNPLTRMAPSVRTSDAIGALAPGDRSTGRTEISAEATPTPRPSASSSACSLKISQ